MAPSPNSETRQTTAMATPWIGKAALSHVSTSVAVLSERSTMVG
jgi:hypothetical protein